MKKTLIIAVVLLLSNVMNAQKKFNFAYTIDRGDLDRGGIVFFSPIVPANIEDSMHDMEKLNIERQWEKKIFANYALDTSHFKTHSRVCNSFEEAKNKRDLIISNFKRLQYKVYSIYSFGFRYVELD